MWDAKRDVKVGEDLLLMHKYLFRVYTQGRNSSQKPSKCVRLQTNNWFISRAWDMRSEQALFTAHAANIQVMSAYPVKYIRKKIYIYGIYIFFFLFGACLLHKPVTDRRDICCESPILQLFPRKVNSVWLLDANWKRTPITGIQLLFESGDVLCGPFCRLTDRRLRLPFPDSSQWGVCRVVPVMAQLLCRSRWPGIITPGSLLLATYNWPG